MTREKRETVWVGLFVIVACVLLVFIVFSLSGLFAGSAKSFHAKFPNAAGLEPGASVHYAGGPKIGRVEKMTIDPNNPGLIDMTFSVKDNIPVKLDSTASIMSYSPLGDNHLEIKPGSAQSALAPNGTYLKTKPYIGFNDLSEEISNLSPQVQQVLSNLNARITQLSTTLDRVNDLLKDDNRQNVSASLAQLRAMLTEDRPLIKHTLTNVDAVSAKIQPLVDQLSKTTEQAQTTIKHLDDILGENRQDLRASIVKLRQSLNNVTVLTQRLNQTLDANSDNIDEILDNLRATTENLKEFTDLIKQRPASILNYTIPRDHKPGAQP
jgi:phospholipid/cholesterol/gamma-HCH transport system substrate-binding protein